MVAGGYPRHSMAIGGMRGGRSHCSRVCPSSIGRLSGVESDVNSVFNSHRARGRERTNASVEWGAVEKEANNNMRNGMRYDMT